MEDTKFFGNLSKRHVLFLESNVSLYTFTIALYIFFNLDSLFSIILYAICVWINVKDGNYYFSKERQESAEKLSNSFFYAQYVMLAIMTFTSLHMSITAFVDSEYILFAATGIAVYGIHAFFRTKKIRAIVTNNK